PVANDSCVEFFLKTPTSDEYWNFEFNCIGAVNASHRVTRPGAIRLTDEQIASIKRHPSCGTEPFGEKPGIHTWTLTIAIPLTLIGINSADMPSHISGNFYKCAGKATHPHYLSWAPIKSEKPNFHLPEFFAPIQLL
ncbi:MAG: carbohydrate-binding family 9-like protein, partial [Bacteroidales bacterium]|nr:carbohydrate-binding family 9-like protein [Bacteroidales bacterium]MDY5282269.1 carbohydrate-binding family 9-like protein [Sodaliphilus sp.]